ncbi:ABC transporter ATP-binding protein [Paenibacillus silagei]|uniref:ABC-2 type transport system ATP-binding protein n=1 Tax=Paenibacillus silagei TaxID=1670801 RepID=A0ABS4NJZ0_9BACL|nr:ABC transporter ATP-binding protein [Paenibacillus silagei]MBP2110372.1 ABC-2 type transport system ATP-binding protein [Paenibacillus silagei]
MLALDIRNLNKKYPNFQIKDVSFQLEQGYIMGFIGVNGAGKTTTIKSILNMVQADSGEISILGKNIAEHETELKQDIGCAFGDIDFYTRSRLKTLTGITKKFYKNWSDETYYSYLNRFKLDENKKIAELSTGMKVKYSLTLALSHGARLLILDEPTSGLDPVSRDDLLDIFQELIMGGEISILFSTHITSDLERCADYITFIEQGQIVASSEKNEFKESYRLLSGSESQLNEVKGKLISCKINSFGFTGLIHARDIDPAWSLNTAIPTLDDIMIYFAKKEGVYV